jgi:hypothetical protein
MVTGTLFEGRKRIAWLPGQRTRPASPGALNTVRKELETLKQGLVK